MTEMQPRNATIKLSEYQPHPRNYNRHPVAQVERIAHSLATFGQVRSIVVWRGYLLAGHGVAEAAKALGWGELRADVLPDEYPEHLALAYVAADNELSRLSDPDLAQLASILDEAKQTDEELLRAIGYDDDEFEQLLREVEADAVGDNAGADTEPEIDKAEELRQKWGVETGQLWQLGEHRLICGDCTDAEVVARVMGGEKAALCLTDFPYGNNTMYDVYDDSVEELKRLVNLALPLALNVANVALIACGVANVHLYPTPSWILSWHWENTGAGSSRWGFNNWQPVLAYGKDPFLASGKGRKQDSIPFNGSVAKDNTHPCPKNVKLWEWFLLRGSINGNDIVYEPFSGSGTTIIVCENLKRRCRAVEISPGYVAVALERWHQHTGKMPELLT